MVQEAPFFFSFFISSGLRNQERWHGYCDVAPRARSTRPYNVGALRWLQRAASARTHTARTAWPGNVRSWRGSRIVLGPSTISELRRCHVRAGAGNRGKQCSGIVSGNTTEPGAGGNAWRRSPSQMGRGRGRAYSAKGDGESKGERNAGSAQGNGTVWTLTAVVVPRTCTAACRL
jgi:hypothetical protein